MPEFFAAQLVNELNTREESLPSCPRPLSIAILRAAPPLFFPDFAWTNRILLRCFTWTNATDSNNSQ